MNLSGNFGEFRTNHFHTGIDIKTNGKVGFPVYAIEDGWVRRVKVSPFGYGKALYLDHPNGHTSVYAHLSSYNDTISSFLSLAQEKLKRNVVDIFPNKDRIPVKKGDVIGYTGNSGRSGGPHLHFELRTSATEKPLNPLLYGFKIKDSTAPSINSLVVEDLSNDARGLVESAKKYFPIRKGNGLVISSVIKVPDNFGFSVHSLDRVTGSSNSFGIYSYELVVDEKVLFKMALDSLDFSTNRYINAHKNYRIFKDSKSSIHRCYKAPNNKLDIYSGETDGVFTLEDDEIHHGKLTVKDVNGNSSVLTFRFQLSKKGSEGAETYQNSYLHFDQPHRLNLDGFTAHIPAYRLVNDVEVNLKKLNSKNSYSGTYSIGNDKIPVQNTFLVSLELKNNSEIDSSKFFISRFNPKNGRSYNQGGEFRDGWIQTRVKQFGTYYLNYDTQPPTAKLTSSKSKLESKRVLYFTIHDDNSGIEDYFLWLNNEWIPLYYNYKLDRLEAQIPDDFNVTGEVNYELTVIDERKNSTVLKGGV